MRSSTFTPRAAFQIARLGRRQIVVEDHRVRIGRPDHQLQLLDLPLAQIGRLIGRGPALSEAADNFRPCGFYQPGQFVQVIAGRVAIGQLDADQNGRLALNALLTVCFLHYELGLLSDFCRAVEDVRATNSCSIIPHCQGVWIAGNNDPDAPLPVRTLSRLVSRGVLDPDRGGGPRGSPTSQSTFNYQIYSIPKCPP